MHNDRIDRNFPAIRLAEDQKIASPAELHQYKLKELAERLDQFHSLGTTPNMGRRANFRLARTMPKAREGLGKSQQQGARFPASRLHQAHVEKANA